MSLDNIVLHFLMEKNYYFKADLSHKNPFSEFWIESRKEFPTFSSVTLNILLPFCIRNLYSGILSIYKTEMLINIDKPWGYYTSCSIKYPSKNSLYKNNKLIISLVYNFSLIFNEWLYMYIYELII